MEKELIKHLRWEEETLTNFYGKVIVEPLYRGIGTTLGNSLRRTLLSYIEGAAPISIRVDGATHEFSTIPGLKEDILELSLNIKKLVVKLPPHIEKVTLKLNVSQPGEVYAASIETPSDVEIINKNLYIATLSNEEKGKLKLEIDVKRGYGWVPQPELIPEGGAPLGTIFLDALFSPILKVTYDVERLTGKWADYESLILEVWTNGSVEPKSAVEEAANLLIKELLIFSSEELRESYRKKEKELEEKEEKEKLKEQLCLPMEDLYLSARALNSLTLAGIKQIKDIVYFTDNELLRLKHFGRKSLNEVKDKLNQRGLNFGMKREVMELFGEAPTIEIPPPKQPAKKVIPKIEKELPIIPQEELEEEEREISEEEEFAEEGLVEEEELEEGEFPKEGLVEEEELEEEEFPKEGLMEEEELEEEEREISEEEEFTEEGPVEEEAEEEKIITDLEVSEERLPEETQEEKNITNSQDY
jgi:DNA-directed RNA polymerase subunit alpha